MHSANITPHPHAIANSSILIIRPSARGPKGFLNELIKGPKRYSTLLDATRRNSTLLDATLLDATLLDATLLDATLLDATLVPSLFLF
jgi:hypothetical protein